MDLAGTNSTLQACWAHGVVTITQSLCHEQDEIQGQFLSGVLPHNMKWLLVSGYESWFGIALFTAVGKKRELGKGIVNWLSVGQTFSYFLHLSTWLCICSSGLNPPLQPWAEWDTGSIFKWSTTTQHEMTVGFWIWKLIWDCIIYSSWWKERARQGNRQLIVCGTDI